MRTENIDYQITAVCTACIIFSTLTIVLRTWSRAVSKTIDFWWDDHFAALGWLFGIANCALSLHWEHVGLGRHMKAVLASGITVSQILLPVFIEDFLYNTGITFVKLSALSFYARIFKGNKRFRILLWIGASLVISWWITFTVLAICTCNPVQKQWDSELPGTCLSQQATFIAAATPNVAIDLFILLLPMPLVWPLQMPLRRRLAVIAIFFMGYCVMIVSIVRLVTVVQFQRKGTSDFTWNWTEPQVLVLLEVPLGVFSVCLPTNLQLVRRVINKNWQAIFRTGRPGAGLGASFSAHAPIAEPDEETDGRARTAEEAESRFVDSLRPADESESKTWVDRGTDKSIPMEEIRVQVDIDVGSDEGSRHT